MAIVTRMASDISGKEGAEDEFVTLVVREHVALDEARAFDVLPDELTALKGVDDLVVLEVGENGEKKQMVVKLSDFRKLLSDDKVKAGRKTRGRRPGFSPSSPTT